MLVLPTNRLLNLPAAPFLCKTRYFGARLAAQGQRVSFMVRTNTLDAVRKNGVRVNSISGHVTVPAEQLGPIIDTGNLDSVPSTSMFEADVIVMACKAWQIEPCLKMCRPWCGAKTLILPLQNGVEGFDKIKSVVASWGLGRALAGCCNIVSAIQEPGMIRHWAADPPYITFGEFEGSAGSDVLQLQAIFDQCAGMEGRCENEAMPKIWEKFCFICSTTGVGATTGTF